MYKEYGISGKGLFNGIVAGIVCWAIIIMTILWLTGCTVMGSKPELYPCVSEPRPLEDVDISVRYGIPFVTTDSMCREQIRETGKTPMPRIISMYSACATLPCDASIPDTGPYCKVVLPHGTEEGSVLWDHEMRHCQGFQH